MIEEKNKGGRPRAINSPDEFDQKVDDYINDCRSNKKPILLTGLILSLGLSSRESFYQYAEYKGYSDSVKRARLFVESEYETRLVSTQNQAANIFALKNFGWKDKETTELEKLQAEKLRRELDSGQDDDLSKVREIVFKVVE